MRFSCKDNDKNYLEIDRAYFGEILRRDRNIITIHSKYSEVKEFCIDEIAQEFQKNYDGRFFMQTTMETLLYKLFENKDYNRYEKLLKAYKAGIKEKHDLDSLYELSIKTISGAL